MAKTKHRILPAIGFCQLVYKRFFPVGQFITYDLHEAQGVTEILLLNVLAHAFWRAVVKD